MKIFAVSLLLVLSFLYLPAGKLEAQVFRRGEADGRPGLNITDAIHILRFLFAGEPAMLGCMDAADVDDDGSVAINDAVYLLNFLFRRGLPLPDPFPECGLDPTEDTLGCMSFAVGGSCPNLTGFFFAVDRSGSFTASGRLAIAKRELIRTLEVLSSTAELGIVFYDANLARFPADGNPVLATDANRSAAIDFVRSIPGGSGSCIQEGLLAALDFSDLANSRRKVISCISDGGGT